MTAIHAVAFLSAMVGGIAVIAWLGGFAGWATGIAMILASIMSHQRDLIG